MCNDRRHKIVYGLGLKWREKVSQEVKGTVREIGQVSPRAGEWGRK